MRHIFLGIDTETAFKTIGVMRPRSEYNIKKYIGEAFFWFLMQLYTSKLINSMCVKTLVYLPRCAICIVMNDK